MICVLTSFIAILAAHRQASQTSSFRPFPDPGNLPLVLKRVPGAPYDNIEVEVAQPSAKARYTIAVQGESVTASDIGQGKWLLKPRLTGEVSITVTEPQASAVGQVTALVFKHVGDSWGVPYAAPGPFLNSAGWEDSVDISPDGNYLVFEYSPMTISGVLKADPKNPWAYTVRGPIGPPERPGFPANRIHNGIITFSYPLLGLASVDRVLPATELYLFKRNTQGIFVPVAPFGPSDGGDGLLGAYGPEFATGTAAREEGKWWLAFTFANYFRDPDPRHQVYANLFDPENPQRLGRYYRDTSGIKVDGFNSALLAPISGADRGNPHIHLTQTRALLFADDEGAVHPNIWFSEGTGRFPNDTWSAWVRLPSPVNAPTSNAVQPFFDGKQLVTRKDGMLKRFAYLGGTITDSTSWGPEEIWMQPDNSMQPGRIVAVGEPSIAQITGRDVLCFVYAVVDPDLSLDMNIGFVERPATSNGSP